MASSDVDKAFIQRFINQNFGLPIAHENLPYKPTGAAYAELLCIANDITPYSLKDTDETDGLFRVILRYPTQKGAVPAKDKADAILAAFKIGTKVCYSAHTGADDVCATVMGQRREAGVAEDGWFKVVVTIRYRSFLGR